MTDDQIKTKAQALGYDIAGKLDYFDSDEETKMTILGYSIGYLLATYCDGTSRDLHSEGVRFGEYILHICGQFKAAKNKTKQPKKPK